MRASVHVWLAISLCALAGCEDAAERADDARDATSEPSATSDDDAGSDDVSAPEAGATPMDAASAVDARVTPREANDAHVTDADLQDAGRVDAGRVDAGRADVGRVDHPAADLAYDAFTKLFYTLRDGKGYFVNNSGSASADAFWTEAELIEMAIDAYERKPSDAYKQRMTELINGFVAVHGADWTRNDFNDDIAWMVIASARAHVHTKNPDFLSYAKKNWDAMYARAWSADYGGGLWWKVKVDSKNAAVNGPGAIGAYLLFKATGDAGYLDKAKAIYEWEKKTLFDPTTGAILDNVNSKGGDKWTFTYNSGTFIGIANYLYQETRDKAYLNDAKLAANFVKTRLSDADGLIKENDVTGDGAAFKPIMFRWLAKLVYDNALEADYVPWLQYNANRAWANHRAGDNISWNNWKEATPHRILDAHGAMATVQLLQVAPAGGKEFAWYNGAAQSGRQNLEAEACDEKRGMTIEASELDGEQLGAATSGSWARYGQVDFGANAPTMVDARASVDSSAGGNIELHLDSLNGPLIATINLTSTGNWTTYREFSTALSPVTGTHDVFLAFKPGAGKTYVCNLNWFKLR